MHIQYVHVYRLLFIYCMLSPKLTVKVVSVYKCCIHDHIYARNSIYMLYMPYTGSSIEYIMPLLAIDVKLLYAVLYLNFVLRICCLLYMLVLSPFPSF